MSAAVPAIRDVRLYGPLRARFGRSFRLQVDSPAEAVRALCLMVEGFRLALLSHKGPGYRVLVRGGAAPDWRDERTLALGAGAGQQICIVPVISGRKRNGLGNIIVGAVMVAAGYYLNSPELVKAGVGVALGGLVQALSPPRMGSASTAPREVSASIDGPPNITSEGGPVPLLIGRVWAGGVVISQGIATDEYTPPAAPLPPPPVLPVDEPADWTAPGWGDRGS